MKSEKPAAAKTSKFQPFFPSLAIASFSTPSPFYIIQIRSLSRDAHFNSLALLSDGRERALLIKFERKSIAPVHVQTAMSASKKQ